MRRTARRRCSRASRCACPPAYLANEFGTEAAQLIARLPSIGYQEKALEYIRQDAQARLAAGGKASHRSIQALLSEKFSLDLHDAVFDIADAELLPDAGSCTDCWKRSGNAPEFADIVELGSKVDGQRSGSVRDGADVCTDPDCFAEKKKVHLLRIVCRAPKAVAPATIESEPTKQYVELVVTDGATSHGDAHETPGSTAHSTASSTVEDQEAPTAEPMNKPVRAPRRKPIDADATPATLASRSRLDLLKRVRERALATERSAFDLRLVAKFVCESIAWRHRATLEGLYDCGIGNLASRIDTMHPSEVALFLLDCALAASVMVGEDDTEEQPVYLMAAAERYLAKPLECAAEQ